ncbi:hypothetical protein ACFPM1_03625 [Halorubrum rubrum]|uniref:Uncharacterized protein n=1 Tax=Halorubrum rubrum TaxID=1126240 RepID=A0ABD5QYV8_9EURY|nr:hypothetical protein [Halorubrum rubrum]
MSEQHGGETEQSDGGIDRFEAYERKTDEVWEGLEESYAAGFSKAIEVFDIETDAPRDPSRLKETEFIGESHYYYWEGRTLPLESYLQEQFGVGIAATEGTDDNE